MDFSYDKEAQDLWERFDCTKQFTVEQIKDIWQDHSQEYAAHWLIHQGRTDADIARVLKYYKVIDEEIYRKI